MPNYLVETYLARCQAREREAREQRARSAAEELTQELTRVRFDGLIHIPEDEICFYVFDAPSADDAEAAARRAGLDPIRIVQAVSSTKEKR
jgi:predicted aminopeptidase